MHGLPEEDEWDGTTGRRHNSLATARWASGALTHTRLWPMPPERQWPTFDSVNSECTYPDGDGLLVKSGTVRHDNTRTDVDMCPSTLQSTTEATDDPFGCIQWTRPCIPPFSGRPIQWFDWSRFYSGAIWLDTTTYRGLDLSRMSWGLSGHHFVKWDAHTDWAQIDKRRDLCNNTREQITGSVVKATY